MGFLLNQQRFDLLFGKKLPPFSLSVFLPQYKIIVYICLEKTLFIQNTLIRLSDHRDINQTANIFRRGEAKKGHKGLHLYIQGLDRTAEPIGFAFIQLIYQFASSPLNEPLAIC
jgi:hypothetical protein